MRVFCTNSVCKIWHLLIHCLLENCPLHLYTVLVNSSISFCIWVRFVWLNKKMSLWNASCCLVHASCLPSSSLSHGIHLTHSHTNMNAVCTCEVSFCVKQSVLFNLNRKELPLSCLHATILAHSWWVVMKYSIRGTVSHLSLSDNWNQADMLHF